MSVVIVLNGLLCVCISSILLHIFVGGGLSYWYHYCAEVDLGRHCYSQATEANSAWPSLLG